MGVEGTLWPASSPDRNPAQPLVGSAQALQAGETETAALADLREKSRAEEWDAIPQPAGC